MNFHEAIFSLTYECYRHLCIFFSFYYNRWNLFLTVDPFGELSNSVDPITLWSLSSSSRYTFTTGSISFTGTPLKCFLSFLFSSSNFCWYQFNSYIYVNASQVHILLQISPDPCLTSCRILTVSPSVPFFPQPSNQFPVVFSCFCEITFPNTCSNKVCLHYLFLYHQSIEA